MEAWISLGALRIRVEAASVKELYKAVAQVQEAFDADVACGLCGEEALRYRIRIVEKNEFYELACLSCGARLTLGQHREGGTLFPKRDGQHGGWAKYTPPPHP